MDIKQVIIINGALNMSPGKMAAQACHAAVEAAFRADATVLGQWRKHGITKIILRGKDADYLQALLAKANAEQLPTYLVTDEGRTEIAPGSVTALAIGPGEIDSITGHLPLY